MKTFKYYILLFSTVFLLTSCSDNDYQNVVPKDSNVIASFNVSSLFNEVDVNEDDVELIENIVDESLKGKEKELFLDFLDGKHSFGIDLNSPIYLFNSKNCALGISMKVNSESDLDNLFDMLYDNDACEKIKENDGYKWVTINRNTKVAYNSNLLLFCTDANEKIMRNLLNNPEEKSFISSPDYKRFSEKENSPLSLFANLSLLDSRYLRGVNQVLPSGVNFSDLNLLLDFALKKGEAGLNLELYSNNEKIQQLLEKSDDYCHTINGDFIKAPEDFLVWFCSNLNGEKLFDKLKSNENVRAYLNAASSLIDFPKIIKSIDGDMAFIVTQNKSSNTQDVVMTAKLKDSQFLKDVDYWKNQMTDYHFRMDENDTNDYTIYDEYGDVQLNWGVDNNNFYAFSENANYRKAFAETNKLLDDETDNIKKSVFYACFNLDYIYEESKSQSLRYADTEARELFEQIDFPFDKVVIKASSPRVWSFSIHTKDKNKGVLEALYDIFSTPDIHRQIKRGLLRSIR